SAQIVIFFFSSRRRHTRFSRDWSSDVCSSDLGLVLGEEAAGLADALTAGIEVGLGELEHADHVGRLLLDDEEQERDAPPGEGLRSEERRVGKESRCRW